MLKKIKKRFSKTVSVTEHQTLNEMCLNGKVYEVKEALAKGGDPNSRGFPRHQGSCGTMCCYGTWGQTPLMVATMGNHPEVVALLLSQPGIEVNTKSGTYGKTALHFAIEKGREAALSLLLAAPGVDLNARDGGVWGWARTLGSTPIQNAIHYGNEEAVRLMASMAEVDLDVKNSRGEGLEDLAHS